MMFFLQNKEYKRVLLSFIRDVNLQCTMSYFENPEWIEWLRPETVKIIEKVKDHDYDYLRKAVGFSNNNLSLLSKNQKIFTELHSILGPLF